MMDQKIVVHIGLCSRLQGGTELVIRYHLEYLEGYPQYSTYVIYSKNSNDRLGVKTILREVPGVKLIYSVVSYGIEVVEIALEFMRIVASRGNHRPQIYIVTHYPQHIWIASLLAMQYKCKLLFYNHQDACYLPHSVRLLLKASIKLVDTLVVLNSSTANMFRQSNRTLRIVQAKNPSRFKAIDKQDDLQERPKTILLVARDHPVKQIDLAIQAFRASMVSTEGWKLHIIGSDETRYTRLLDEDKVSSIDFTPYTENISAEYLRSKCTLCSSSMEEFGMTIVEGFSFGLPCIVFIGLAGPSDIVKHNYNGLVAKEPNSIRSLASMIKTFCLNPALQSVLAKGAYRSATDFEKDLVIQSFYHDTLD